MLITFTFLARKYSGFKVQIKTFNQSRYPRINRESLMPVARLVKTILVLVLVLVFVVALPKDLCCRVNRNPIFLHHPAETIP